MFENPIQHLIKPMETSLSFLYLITNWYVNKNGPEYLLFWRNGSYPNIAERLETSVEVLTGVGLYHLQAW